jgi:hypothetical protein
MDPVEPSHRQPVADRASSKPQLRELPAGDDSMLASRQSRDLPLTWWLWCTTVVLNSDHVGHAAHHDGYMHA